MKQLNWKVVSECRWFKWFYVVKDGQKEICRLEDTGDDSRKNAIMISAVKDLCQEANQLLGALEEKNEAMVSLIGTELRNTISMAEDWINK